MFELVYMSVASPTMTSALARNIAEQSQMNNALTDISGLLMFDGSNFTQVLQGEEASVRRLLETISADDRHSELTVLAQGPVAERSLAGWSMAYVDNTNVAGLSDRMADIISARTAADHVAMQRALERLKSLVLDSLRGN